MEEDLFKMPKKKLKGIERDLLGVAGAGVGLAVASGIGAAAGAPAGVQAGIGAAGGFLGPVAGLAVAKHAFKTFKPKKKKGGLY